MKNKSLFLILLLTICTVGKMKAQSCNPINVTVTNPYVENFSTADWPHANTTNNYDLFSEYPENCWHVPYTIVADGGTPSPRLWYNGEGSPRHISLKEGSSTTAQDQYVLFPAFSNPLKDLNIKFKAKLNMGGNRKLYIGYYNTETREFTQLKEVTVYNSAYSGYGPFDLNENGNAPDTFNVKLRLAFRFPGNADQYSCDITEITVGTYLTTINSDADWVLFCNQVDGFITYQGRTVTLGNDIQISKTTGGNDSESHSFRGTFNGQGHQLILNGGDFGTPVSPAEDANIAPFTYVWGATFASLEVTGHIYTSNQKAGGFVAVAGGDCDLTFTNCRSSVNIHSSVEGDGTHGGFIAFLKGLGNGRSMTATFTNCAFTGSITTTNNTTNVGGFVGWCEWNSNVYSGRCTLVLNNCVVAPNSPCISEGSKTFARFHNEAESMHFTNCYYNQTIGDAQGKQRYTIEGELGVTVAMAGDAIIYNVSGITAYDNNEGLRYHDTLWAGENDNVHLLLGYYGMGSVTSYYADYGELESTGDIVGHDDPHTLTMPAGDVTIGANFSGDQGYLTICDGGKTNGDIPINSVTPYWNQHTQMIYPASELALMVGREIHSITFYTTSLTSMNVDRWTVALRVTDATTLSGFAPLTDTTQIHSGYLYATNGTMTVTFNNPYFYQGGNLLFDFRHEAAPDAQGDIQYFFMGKEVSGAAYRTRASAAGVINFLPKVTFDYRVATSIPTPLHLTVSGITDHGATLSWEAPAYTTPSRYSYEFKKSTNDWGGGSGGGSGVGGMTSVTLNSLQQATTYDFRVKAIYDGIGESGYLYITFTTRSIPVDVADSWFEDFENIHTNIWEFYDGYFPEKAQWIRGNALNHGGNRSIYITNDGGTTNAYTNDHRLVVYAAKYLHFAKGKYTFSFDWKCVGEEYWDYLQVGLVPGSEAITADSVGTSMPSGWVRLHDQEKLNGSDTWQTTPDKTITIATAGNYLVVLRWQQDYEGGTNPPAAVDNIRITRMFCENDVTGLAASHFTTTTATLNWDDDSGVSGWQVAYSTDSNFPAEETTIVDVTENTLGLTDLLVGTTYYAKVRTHCSDAYGYGEWCNTIQFDTKCEYITEFPWKDDFNRWPSGMEYPTVFDFQDFCWVNKNISGYHHYVFKIIDASVGGSYTYQVDNGNYTHQIFMPIDYSINSEILLVLPGMILPDGITHNYYRFALDIWRNQASIDGPDPYGEGIRVFASTDDVLDEGDRELAFIPRHIHGYSATIPNEERNGYYRYSLPIGEWGNDPCYIILRGENKQCTSIYMDNFEVSVIPNTFTNAYGNNMWTTAANWEPAALGIPDVTDNVEIKAEAIIPYNYVAKADRITLKGGGSIVMQSGAQLWHSNEMVRATVQKTVSQFTNLDVKDRYVLLTSPIVEEIGPTGVVNMFPANTIVDLYRFNQSAQLEWENWKAEGTDNYHFNLQHGEGYLYAHNFIGGDNTLGFNGYIKPSKTPVGIDLVYDPDQEFTGWNLIGNPFVCNAYVDHTYFRMNEVGNGFVSASPSVAISPCEGIFVVAASAEDDIATFSITAPSSKGGDLVLNLGKSQEATIDNVRLCFGEGASMRKLVLNESSPKVYIAQEGKDYAVVTADRQMGEIPVSFKAENNGRYTLTADAEEVSFSYLHLIDNMTGADVDLLTNPSYTFDARMTDYESRFKLVFATDGEEGSSTGSEAFAFYNNGNWIIANEGRATLQVIDMMGRIVKSETINGNATINLNQTPGVYMFRLVSGDSVKVQKVVVR